MMYIMEQVETMTYGYARSFDNSTMDMTESKTVLLSNNGIRQEHEFTYHLKRNRKK
jgi:hypothetical protein